MAPALFMRGLLLSRPVSMSLLHLNVIIVRNAVIQRRNKGWDYTKHFFPFNAEQRIFCIIETSAEGASGVHASTSVRNSSFLLIGSILHYREHTLTLFVARCRPL